MEVPFTWFATGWYVIGWSEEFEQGPDQAVALFRRGPGRLPRRQR